MTKNLIHLQCCICIGKGSITATIAIYKWIAATASAISVVPTASAIVPIVAFIATTSIKEHNYFLL